MNESIIRDLIKYMDVEENAAIQYIQTEHRMKLGLFWGIQEGSRVLEIGCGTGKNTEFLQTKAERLVAADFSPEMLERAKAKIRAEHVEFRQMDFWVGEWDLEFTNPDGSIGHAENRVTRDAHGDCVITEHFRQPNGGPGGADYTGSSFSTYDRGSRSWRQMWVDNQGGLFDLRGGPVTGAGHVFELVNIEPRGPDRRTMRMIWQDVTPDSLVWRWQAKADDGIWRDAWVLRYRRR